MVMTTEVLRNMLLESPHSLDDVAVVVFDEVHFLADPERGTTWEEAIIYCPKHVQLVCLSATVPNAQEITTWISHIHRETALVAHAHRTIPLEHLYLVDDQLYPLVDEEGHAKQPLLVGGEARIPRPQGAGHTRPREVPRPRDVVRRLDGEHMLPAIYFIFGRRACEIAASDCSGLDLIPSRDSRAARRERIDAYLGLLEPEDRLLEQVQSLVTLLHRGIAFHHAGVLPLLKSLVEELFAAGHVGVVFATETLALGINMPARSVVIAEQTKFDGESRRPLLPNEYAQLVGRAGRRGLDPKGFSVSLYSPWVTCSETLAVITGELLPVRSSFTPRYNTVAALWDGTPAARDRLVRLFASSLRQFQMNDALKESTVEVEALRERAAGAHFECPYDGVPDDAVQEYSRLRRELADARKRAQRAASAATALRRQLLRPPWPVPNPDVVRREFQRFAGGELVYVAGSRAETEAPRVGAWGVFLRRHHTGPGLILIGDRIEEVTRWADISRLPDGRPAIDLPSELQVVTGPIDDAPRLLGPGAWRALQSKVARLDLPDLSGFESRRQSAYHRDLERQLAQSGAREDQHAGDVSALESAVGGHPCRACPVRADHERALRAEQAAIRALAEAAAYETTLERRAASQAEETLDALTSLLRRFAYIGPRAGGPDLLPTPKAAALARLYDANGLLLLNLAWDGIFDHLPPAEMMEVLSWFCYDRDGPRWNRHQLTPRLWDLRPQIGDALDRVRQAEAHAGIAITLGPNSTFYGPVLAWCRRATFAELLEKIPISEGDLLLTLNKALDLATQLREALRTGAPSDARARQLAAKLDVGDRLLRRGIVAQSLSLATALPTTEP
jgi:ATP-dependent RNA helicase HelY